MNLQDEIERYKEKFLEEEKKFLEPLQDSWFYFNEDGEIETDPDIIIIKFAEEGNDVYRGLSFLPDKGKYVLFYSSGEINKSCEISRERAIEYMVLCDKDLIYELELDAEVFELLCDNVVLNGIYYGEYEII